MKETVRLGTGKDFNPGRARWCETHERLECTHDRRKGGPCHKNAIAGTDSCELHSGMPTEVARTIGEATVNAWSAIANGTPTIDPGQAVLGMLQMSWLRAAAYGELLQRQVERGEAQENPDPFANPAGPGSARTAGGPGSAVAHANELSTAGLIGHQYAAAGKDGTIYASGEAVRALVILEGTERDRVVKYAKVAHDMGISDRMIEQAERWSGVVATRVANMIEELDLTPEQQRLVPQLVERYLGSIDMNTVDGEVV